MVAVQAGSPVGHLGWQLYTVMGVCVGAAALVVVIIAVVYLQTETPPAARRQAAENCQHDPMLTVNAH